MKEITKKDLRQFGVGLGVILVILGTIHFFKHNDKTSYVLWGISIFPLISGIFIPNIIRPVYKVFLKVAHAIGWFNTRVILIVLYYLLLTPIGLIMKLFGKDLLNIRIDKKQKSYWIKRQTVRATRETLERQF